VSAHPAASAPGHDARERRVAARPAHWDERQAGRGGWRRSRLRPSLDPGTRWGDHGARGPQLDPLDDV